jgi:hypothetical protein
MTEKKETSLKSWQDIILTKFKEIGIEGHVGQPHLQRENASLVIPNTDNNKKLILR